MQTASYPYHKAENHDTEHYAQIWIEAARFSWISKPWTIRNSCIIRNSSTLMTSLLSIVTNLAIFPNPELFKGHKEWHYYIYHLRCSSETAPRNWSWGLKIKSIDVYFRRHGWVRRKRRFFKLHFLEWLKKYLPG